MPLLARFLLLLVAAVLLGEPCGAARLQAAAAQPSTSTGAGTMAAAFAALREQNPAAARAHWGISIVDAATGAPLFAENDGELFAPASNAKLFTTSTALALLGPGYTCITRVVAEGTIDATGTLHGDLRLIGGADPTLSGRAYPYSGRTERPNPPLAGLDTLAAQVVASGIHAVQGSILADDTLFPLEPYGRGWSWDDLQWEYGAPVSALPINDDARYLTVVPGAAPGAPLATSWLPAVPGVPDALLVTATTSGAGQKPALGLSELPGDPLLRVFGTLPAAGAPVHVALALADPARFAAEAFRASLNEAGLTVSGPSAPVHQADDDTESFAVESHLPVPLVPLASGAASLLAPPSAGRVVAVRRSVPLADIVTVTNKVSQNLHAELLLRLVGAAEGAGGTAVGGARVRRALLTTEAGIQPDDFLLYDGSGLSPEDRVTPRALTTLLHWSVAQPWGAVLRASLPVGGVDGTLSGRFADLRGRVEAKTGTLSETSALSGFLQTDSGRTVIFSILCNDDPGGAAHDGVDTLVEAAARAF